MQDILSDLIKQELIHRQDIINEIDSRKKKIEILIYDYCKLHPNGKMSRAEWQEFCFNKIFNKITPPNVPFKIDMNKIMLELGFSLGYAHTKKRIYRGLEWK